MSVRCAIGVIDTPGSINVPQWTTVRWACTGITPSSHPARMKRIKRRMGMGSSLVAER